MTADDKIIAGIVLGAGGLYLISRVAKAKPMPTPVSGEVPAPTEAREVST